jgi:hypothetical protein
MLYSSSRTNSKDIHLAQVDCPNDVHDSVTRQGQSLKLEISKQKSGMEKKYSTVQLIINSRRDFLKREQQHLESEVTKEAEARSRRQETLIAVTAARLPLKYIDHPSDPSVPPQQVSSSARPFITSVIFQGVYLQSYDSYRP